MATNWPNSVQTFTNPTAGSALNSPSHADQHTTVNDTVEALQTYSGVVLTSEQSFSSVASLTLNNCFNSNYRNYRLVMNVIGSANGASCNLQFRSGGSTDTSANYNRLGYYYTTSFASLSATGQTSAYVVAWSNTQYSPVTMDIFTPNEATNTRMLHTAAQSDSNLLLNLHHYIATATAYDGIIITPSSGTMSGHILVMGYNGT
jgi:hypothetical protein